jgi:ERF superfamily
MMFKKATAIVPTEPPGDLVFTPAPAPEGPLHDILRVAVEKGIDFQELLAAQREMIAMQEERALSQALAAFQLHRPVIEHNQKVMNKDGRTVRYTYADLDQIMTTIGPALGAHGLSVTWDTQLKDRVYTAVAYLRCGGATVTASFPSAVDPEAFMTDQQKGASANSFAMRYAVIMVLGLTSCGMTDDNGRSAGAAPRITDTQGSEIHALIEQTKSDLFKFLKIFGVETIAGIAASDYDRAMGMLKKKVAKMKEEQ